MNFFEKKKKRKRNDLFSIIIELQFTFYEKFPLTIKGINDSCDKNEISIIPITFNFSFE